MNKIKKLFEVDLRSMALFRFALGLVLLGDLLSRSIWIKAHYTDFGIVPRKYLLDEIIHDFRFSFHIFNGQVEFQAVLFIVAFIFALAYTLGYKTKLSGFISWVLLLSLQNRNSLILNAGDVITRMMLFWSLFMPLSKVFSIDSALNKKNKIVDNNYTYFSLANVFFLLQLSCMYWFSIKFKTTHYWIDDHLAVYYALHIDQYAKPLAIWLRQFVWLTKAFTIYTLTIEVLGPLLALTPFRWGWVRFLGACLMINLHLGLFFTLTLGTFPWICMAAWLAFFPSCFWELMEKLFRRKLQSRATVYADGDCNFCLKLVIMLKSFLILPSVKLKIAQKHPTQEKIMRDENSWVLETDDGRTLLRFEAFLHLLSMSPILGWMSALLSFTPIKSIGTWGYKTVANNRDKFSVMTKYLTTPSEFKPPGKITNILLTGCFTFVVLHVFSNYNLGIHVPQSIKNFGRAFSLMQHWNMFANPKTRDGWFVIRGELLSSQEVNVWTEEFGKVSPKKPLLVSDQFPDNRWRKYIMGIMSGDKQNLNYFAKYLCRRWNAKYSGDERLKTFKIYFFQERTRDPGLEFPIKKKKLWTHNCGIKK